jgi:RNA 2',3'-cyclic 3'-phosphodiesterase
VKRTFIAFDILPAERLNREYDFIRKQLREENLAWTTIDNLHITLNFLGDTRESVIPDIIRALHTITDSTAGFDFTLQSFGVFKSLAEPRVIWFGCSLGAELIQLKKQLDLSLMQFGFQPEKREFSPHMTLGRVKFMRSVNMLDQLISQYEGTVFQRQQVHEIILYESTLTPGGSIYTPLHRFPLQQK